MNRERSKTVTISEAEYESMQLVVRRAGILACTADGFTCNAVSQADLLREVEAVEASIYVVTRLREVEFQAIHKIETVLLH